MNRSRGLSLVEVLLAIALLSIALISLISKIHGCMGTARVTEYQNAAREFAKEVLAEIEAGTIDGLFDGYIGDFTDRGYPQLRYSVGLGESSAVGTNPALPVDKNTGLFRKPADPNNNDTTDASKENEAEEPFTRVRISVDFPTADEEKLGVFVLEKMVPTECTKGARGLEEKKQRDADAAKNANTGATPPPTGGAPVDNKGNSKGGKPTGPSPGGNSSVGFGSK